VLALVALAQNRFGNAIDACDRAIAVLPDHAAFHASRALALAADDAANWTLLGRALLGPDGDEGRPRSSAERAAGDTAAAEAAWRSALALDPANVETMFYLGNAARERGGSAEAIRIYEERFDTVPATRSSSTT